MRHILLPLALVLSAIAIFELGASYGATNVRAIAVAAQLQTFLNFYEATPQDSDVASVQKVERIIDHHIATAALQRENWLLRLKEEPRSTLDRALQLGLSVRGDAALEHLSGENASIERVVVSPEQIEAIKRAIARAREELLVGE